MSKIYFHRFIFSYILFFFCFNYNVHYITLSLVVVTYEDTWNII